MGEISDNIEVKNQPQAGVESKTEKPQADETPDQKEARERKEKKIGLADDMRDAEAERVFTKNGDDTKLDGTEHSDTSSKKEEVTEPRGEGTWFDSASNNVSAGITYFSDIFNKMFEVVKHPMQSIQKLATNVSEASGSAADQLAMAFGPTLAAMEKMPIVGGVLTTPLLLFLRGHKMDFYRVLGEYKISIAPLPAKKEFRDFFITTNDIPDFNDFMRKVSKKIGPSKVVRFEVIQKIANEEMKSIKAVNAANPAITSNAPSVGTTQAQNSSTTPTANV